jgi:hypothetical protein
MPGSRLEGAERVERRDAIGHRWCDHINRSPLQVKPSR